MSEIDRKLATVERIVEIASIPDADKICAYKVRGWCVVDQVGRYAVGDLVVYCEIDSFIPTAIAPFLTKSGHFPKTYEGIEGERLRTAKLRGQVSQGLILPIAKFVPEKGIANALKYFDANGNAHHQVVADGDDVTELLGIVKWNPPVAACLAGLAKGNFPSFGRKTDQERCLSGDTLIDTEDGEVTIKELCDTKSTQKVWAFNHETGSLELKPIIGHSVMTKKKVWVKLTLKSGKVIVVTTNHKIWCDDISAYRNAENIEPGQKFLTKTV